MEKQRARKAFLSARSLFETSKRRGPAGCFLRRAVRGRCLISAPLRRAAGRSLYKSRDGRRLFISMNQAGKVAMFDISNPEEPRLLKVLDLGQSSGPHYIKLTPDEKRLVVSDYFLNEDSFGKVHAEGDHKIHVARIAGNDLVLDSHFQLDFNTAFASGPARPHGVAIK